MKQYVVNSELIYEWDYERNNKLNLNPNEITLGSSKKVWWKCDKGHEWEAPVARRNSYNSKCPICSNRKILKGFNDLATVNPDIAKEWNYDKNKDISIYEVGNGTNKKVWWKCSICGYEWKAVISARTIIGNGCPNCRNDKVRDKFNENGIKKYGSLAESNPNLVKEWNYEKNGDLTPLNIHKWSSKKVWWRCEKGHEWEAVVNQRAISNTGCPICSGELKTSFPEQAIFFYLSKIFGDKSVINRFLYDNKYEIDVFLEKYNIGIEYDGFYYHNNSKTKNTEHKKNLYFQNHNIKLIRVKENGKTKFNNEFKYDVISISKDPKYDEIDDMIKKLINRINILLESNYTCEVHCYEDRIDIMQNYLSYFKKNSLEALNPELAKEWNYEKNGNITPNMVTVGSRRKVWWKCEKGHEWEYSISDRNNGDGCPICSNRKIIKGVNDLATTHPQLLKEWNYEKNNVKNIYPTNVGGGSPKKVWWKCEKGHEWECSLQNKTTRNSSCPICSNRKIIKGVNDLVTLNSYLAKEWNYIKNDPLKPTDVSIGSSKKVWWKCSTCGYEWESVISSRASGVGCPKCGQIKSQKSFIENKIKQQGSLFDINPKLAKEWNYEKNGDLTPDKVLPESNKKVWWKCEKGHEWEASISKRFNGQNCPYCSNRRILYGYNDLTTTHKDFLKFWDYEKNNTLGYFPENLSHGSDKEVWWKCPNCNYNWQQKIGVVTKSIGCPKCHIKIKNNQAEKNSCKVIK